MSKEITESDLDRHFAKQLHKLNETCARMPHKIDIAIAYHWVTILKKAKKEEKFNRSCLIVLMCSQLADEGELGLPFVDERYQTKPLEDAVNSYHGDMYALPEAEGQTEQTKKNMVAALKWQCYAALSQHVDDSSEPISSSSNVTSKTSVKGQTCKLCELRSNHAMPLFNEGSKCDRYKAIDERLEKLHTKLFHSDGKCPQQSQSKSQSQSKTTVTSTTPTTPTTTFSSSEFVTVAQDLIKQYDDDGDMKTTDKRFFDVKFEQRLIDSFKHYHDYHLHDVQQGFENKCVANSRAIIKKLTYMVILKQIMIEDVTERIQNTKRFVDQIIDQLAKTL